MKNIQIVPAILEKELSEIKEKVKLVENLESLIHVDLADGKFVSNTTFIGVDEINEIFSHAEFELHLMVEDPIAFVPQEAKTIKRIVVHVESSLLSRERLEEIQERGFEIRLAINPETETADLEPYIEYAQSVQIMAIHPGAQGKEFMPESLERIKDFKKNYPNIPIAVDGGITPKTAKLCVEAGATIIISGSYLMHCEEIQSCINQLEGSIYGD